MPVFFDCVGANQNSHRSIHPIAKGDQGRCQQQPRPPTRSRPGWSFPRDRATQFLMCPSAKSFRTNSFRHDKCERGPAAARTKLALEYLVSEVFGGTSWAQNLIVVGHDERCRAEIKVGHCHTHATRWICQTTILPIGQ